MLDTRLSFYDGRLKSVFPWRRDQAFATVCKPLVSLCGIWTGHHVLWSTTQTELKMPLLWSVYGWQVCAYVCGRVTERKKGARYGCIEEKTSILQKKEVGKKEKGGWFKVSPAVFSYFATASASFWPLTANLASTPNREQPLPKSNEQRQKGQLTTRLTLQNFDQSVALWETCGLPPSKNCRRWLWMVINGGMSEVKQRPLVLGGAAEIVGQANGKEEAEFPVLAPARQTFGQCAIYKR